MWLAPEYDVEIPTAKTRSIVLSILETDTVTTNVQNVEVAEKKKRAMIALRRAGVVMLPARATMTCVNADVKAWISGQNKKGSQSSSLRGSTWYESYRMTFLTSQAPLSRVAKKCTEWGWCGNLVWKNVLRTSAIFGYKWYKLMAWRCHVSFSCWQCSSFDRCDDLTTRHTICAHHT